MSLWTSVGRNGSGNWTSFGLFLKYFHSFARLSETFYRHDCVRRQTTHTGLSVQRTGEPPFAVRPQPSKAQGAIKP